MKIKHRLQADYTAVYQHIMSSILCPFAYGLNNILLD